MNLGKEDKVPNKVADSFEDFIAKYVGYCNTAEYVKAYNLISDDCKKNLFDNDYNNFVEYVSEKFSTKKTYAIQSYSKYNNKYIYSVKFYDDFLTTGLTNQSYRYVEEKMAVFYDDNKNLVVNVGNYMESKDLQFQNSNDYMKAEITKELDKYTFVVYNLRITNRSNYTIVIKDGNVDSDDQEIFLKIGDENRGVTEDEDIVVNPRRNKRF